MTDSAGITRHSIPFISLLPFIGITFSWAWGILALFIFLPDQMKAMVGTLTGEHPLFYLAVYAPAIAAIAIVIFYRGVEGLWRYLSRLLLWRCSLSWYIFLIIGIPFVFMCGSALKGNLFADPFPFSSFQSLCAAIVFTAIKGPVEELGWRGFALPLLQKKLAPIWAALVLGVIWGFWHLPAFLLSGTQQSQWDFAAFFSGCIALSVIVTPLFNTSRGSIFLPALFHFMLTNPISPDAQPYDSYLLIGVAGLVVWSNRKTMFTRAGSVTEIIPER